MDGRAHTEVSHGHVELSGDPGFASAFRSYRIWHVSRRIGLVLLLGDAQIGRPYVIVSVDIAASGISEKAKSDPNVRLLTASSSSPEVRKTIQDLKA